MSMQNWISEMYGEASEKTASERHLANVEMFCKLAADEGIDLAAMDEATRQQLFEQTMKVAEEEEDDEDEEDEDKKKEAALAHFEGVQEEQAKLAEYDRGGRAMAHAFIDELRQIQTKEASGKAQALKAGLRNLAKAPGNLAKGHRVSKKLQATKAIAQQAGASGDDIARLDRGIATAKGMRNRAGKRLGMAGAAVGGAAGGAAMASKMKKESAARAFDELAAEHAIKTAAAAGYAADEAFNRINAVYILGLGDSEKVASCPDADSGLHVRGLEYLEQAGYPVNWEEVFGS
jgi:hypothetical protein